jgi:S-adenosylmethionine decarboxylase
MSTTEKSRYGLELVLDLHHCDRTTFNRSSIEAFFTDLCRLIEMERCDVHFFDELTSDPIVRVLNEKTKGTSAVCFILTSSIVVHALDLLESVYVNIFSCKDFDTTVAGEFARDWFRGTIVHSTCLQRS